jgi:hypothetical protein
MSFIVSTSQIAKDIEAGIAVHNRSIAQLQAEVAQLTQIRTLLTTAPDAVERITRPVGKPSKTSQTFLLHPAKEEGKRGRPQSPIAFMIPKGKVGRPKATVTTA